MVSIRLNVTKKHKGGFELGPVSLELKGGTTSVVGANGAGKSTLFRIIAGFDRAESRDAVIGLDYQRVGYLPQEMTFPSSATCREYLHHVAWLHKIDRKDRAQAVDSALASVALEDKADKSISTLSGGMRRRLGFAHAIIHNPEILLLDEPTAGLDPLQRQQLRKLVRSQSEGRITLISTHLIDDVQDLSDQIMILREGNLTFYGTQSQLLKSQPETNGPLTFENAVINHMSTNGQ